MKKIEAFQEGMIIPKIEFDLYYKLNGTNLAKLNLSYCSNTKIDISIPIKLPDNIDKYNSSSRYYNDICYVSTSDDGTDITLKDRKEEFMNKNMTVCQDNCFFSGYNYTTNVAKCSCDIKESSSFFDDIKIDKSKLYENFIDIKNIANINILVCYKVLFAKKGLILNYGSYSLMIIITAHLIIIFIFHLKNLYSKIQKKINKISLILNNLDYLNKRNEQDKSQERLISNNFKNINIKFKERLRFKRKIKIKIKLKCFEKYIANYRKDFNNNPPINKKAEKIKNKFKDFPEINSQIIETIRFSKSDTNLKIEKMIKQAKK